MVKDGNYYLKLQTSLNFACLFQQVNDWLSIINIGLGYIHIELRKNKN